MLQSIKNEKLTRIFYDILLNLDKTDSILVDNNYYFLKNTLLKKTKRKYRQSGKIK